LYGIAQREATLDDVTRWNAGNLQLDVTLVLELFRIDRWIC